MGEIADQWHEIVKDFPNIKAIQDLQKECLALDKSVDVAHEAAQNMRTAAKHLSDKAKKLEHFLKDTPKAKAPFAGFIKLAEVASGGPAAICHDAVKALEGV